MATSSSFTVPRSAFPRRRPVIGVTGPDRGGDAAWCFTWLGLALAGASARRISPSCRRCRVVDLDGLVIGGGADVDPRLYGEPLAPMLRDTAERRRLSAARRAFDLVAFPALWLVRQLLARPRFVRRSGRGRAPSAVDRQDHARDALEMRLIDQAVRRGLPILGICRGSQLLNVYFGGTLHQSLSGFYVETPEVRSVRPRKRVTVRPDTRLAAALRPGERWVNALHRQAVDRLGRGVRVAAADPNGIVQAIEHADLPFVIGVQWHPEYLPQRPGQRAIFAALVRAARQRPRSPGNGQAAR